MHYVNFRPKRTQRAQSLISIVALLGVSFGVTACKRVRIADNPPPAAQAKTLDVPFDTFYDAILVRSRPQNERATDWTNRFANNWVRWRGRIVTFTDHSITLRSSEHTSTFDVSLGLTATQLADAQARYHKNQWISFMGRLDSYDDVFRTAYLVQGVVLDDADGGVFNPPPDLAPSLSRDRATLQPYDLAHAK